VRAFICALLLLTGTLAFGMDAEIAFDDPVQLERYNRLNQQLRCLKCRFESIADSPLPIAADLRRQVKELMIAGKSDEEILQFMTDRYGEYVLYKPPLSSRTWLLWAAPVVLLVGGVAAAFVVIARKARLPDTDPADPGLGTS
jgi:cytochrome c-type biogenesis protein CcmH